MAEGKFLVPEEIDDTEELARIIFAPSMICEGELSPSAYFLDNLERGPEKYVSMLRAQYTNLAKEEISFKPRKENDSLYGYALILKKDCNSFEFEDCRISVKPKPNKNNPAHAGIYYSIDSVPIKGKCVDPRFLIMTTYLAKKSKLIEY